MGFPLRATHARVKVQKFSVRNFEHEVRAVCLPVVAVVGLVRSPPFLSPSTQTGSAMADVLQRLFRNR